ncbi:hypothetical protein GOD62_30425 [Sinorhizobium medicae]|nr:hypothetical protein [Sinorhizobium medicae]MDX0760196.1 hypothetical protein [Sinorhizobium medicae]MDX0796884.1 hypothetical protein [Sinorhizobium medicae]
MFEAISQYLADTPHLQSLRRHPVPSSSRRRKKLHTSRTPTPDAFRWGRHHLGIRGRLFLGIGGRDHFGIRGRIASEFAASCCDVHLLGQEDRIMYQVGRGRDGRYLVLFACA